MYIYGSFVNQLGVTVTVHIVTDNDRTKTVEIGGDALYFPAAEPVTIETCVNDTFDHLLRSEAKIKLLTRDFIADFFCASCMDAVVNIYQGDRCLFAGFIEPQTYSQGYNEVYDEVELNCIDAISAMQYSKYRNVGGLGVLYDVVKASAANKTFSDVLLGIFNGITANIDIVGGHDVHYYYDGSKAADNATANRYKVFDQLEISELLFLGGDEDDVWQQDEVAEEILRYLNLHLVQVGFDFYIFSWEPIKNATAITWKDIKAGGSVSTTRYLVDITAENAADTDTTISVGEVFNQILLTCKVESVESIIESPLDDEALISPFSNRQKYITTYSADGEGSTAFGSFFYMTHGAGNNGYDHGKITDWYMQVMNNPAWSFPEPGTGVNLLDKYTGDNTSQERLPNLLAEKQAAAILSLGSVRTSADKKDNSPVSKMEMKPYLVVSVNGNGDDTEAGAYPTEATLSDNAPRAVYTGNTTGGVFSPSDDGTTNYIVLSGSIVLNPLMKFTCSYKSASTASNSLALLQASDYIGTVPSRDNGDGRFYTHQYWKAATPNTAAVSDTDRVKGFIPYTGDGPEQYEFKYSAVGDGSDTISKISVLACMLIIGDKCVVETGTGGQISDFTWKPYKKREQCASDDEYYAQCFTIGFDPKIGDKLVGTEFEMQNNIDYTLGIDAEGIAIPIRKNDHISGQVQFIILGPVNTMWDEISRRHRTWFRRTKWSTKTIPLLSHVSNIQIKDFEVKIYSDNGLINSNEDSDLVYMSDTHETFVNLKDDIEFKISSALTLDECRRLGVTDGVKLSTPVNTLTKSGVLSIYDYTRAASGKPEQQYVDSYYTEYHKPRLQMTQKLDDRDGIVGLFQIYQHPALNKRFYVLGISRDLMAGYAQLQLKEVWA